jgi:hypothetical protein
MNFWIGEQRSHIDEMINALSVSVKEKLMKTWILFQILIQPTLKK